MPTRFQGAVLGETCVVEMSTSGMENLLRRELIVLMTFPARTYMCVCLLDFFYFFSFFPTPHLLPKTNREKVYILFCCSNPVQHKCLRF